MTFERLLAEAYRLRLLGGVEELLEAAGFERVAGVDEAGRGCLAGPVVAAAVVADRKRPLPGVDDSKLLSAEEREALADHLMAEDGCWVAVRVEASTIDRINILESTRRAMAEALDGLRPRPDCALVDAVSLPRRRYPCLGLVRADTLSYSVACASIVAKVTRDRLMGELDERYPQYGFRRHKGYAAPEHLRALEEYGPCPIHRLTFRSVLPRAAEVVH